MEESDSSAENVMDASPVIPGFCWKEPVNGKTAFFTREVYTLLAGPEPSLEESVSMFMDVLGYPSPCSRAKSVEKASCTLSADMSDASIVLSDCPQSSVVTASLASTKWARSEVLPDEDSVEGGFPQNTQTLDERLNLLEVHKEGTIVDGDTFSMIVTDTPASPCDCTAFVEEEESVPVIPDSCLSPAQGSMHQAHVSPVMPTTPSALSNNDLKSQPVILKTAEDLVDTVNLFSTLASSTSSLHQPLDTKVRGPAKNVAKHSSHESTGSNKKGKNFALQQKCKQVSSEKQSEDCGQQTGKRTYKRAPGPKPGKSSLTHEKHKRYLDLFKKCTKKFFSGNFQPPSAREIQELAEFEELHKIVAVEQERCQAFLKVHAMNNPFLYNNMPPYMFNYSKEKEKNGWRRAEMYNRHYNPLCQLPLSVSHCQSVNTNSCMLKLVQTLLQVGTKSHLVLPDVTNMNPTNACKQTVPTNIDKIALRFPPIRPDHFDSPSAWNHEPASKDINMERLVQKYPCQIATSSSVMYTLVNSQNSTFSDAWDIPIIIKEYLIDGISRKVAYLDKPLLPAAKSLSSLKMQYLQKALLTFVCQPSHDKKQRGADAATAIHYKGKPGQSNGRRVVGSADDDDDPFSAAVSMDDLETFGSSRKTSTNTGLSGKGANSSANIFSKSSFFSDAASLTKDKSRGRTPSTVKQSQPESNLKSKVKSESSLAVDTDQRSKDFCTDKAGPAHCVSSELHPVPCDMDGDESDSADDALMIALSGCENTPQRGLASKIVDDKQCIFDHIPSSTSEQLLTSCRVTTHSASLKEGTSASSNNPVGLQSSTIGRVTRQASKRKIDDICLTEPGQGITSDCTACAPKTARPNALFNKLGEITVIEESGMPTDSIKTSPKLSQDYRKPLVSEVQSTPLDSILKDMIPGGQIAKGKIEEDPGHYKQPVLPGEHVGYHLWDLNGISLLIRSSSHAFSRDKKQGTLKPVYIRAKPERQFKYGLEQITQKEAVHSWMGCYLRPNSFFLRARVDMQTQRIVHVEELQPHQILQPTLNFDSGYSFIMLREIFCKLLDLSPGNYLLSHRSGENIMHLQAGTNTKRGSFDLHCYYMSLDVMTKSDKSVPWVPIDPTLVLPHHKRNGQIPATFQPPDAGSRRKQEQHCKGQKPSENKNKKMN